ncbi:DNA adenine methylase [uncultured Treponema sp.]|uniref:DNA adenine methylase n=1 Tax=uncultured Treponema sp. TaxID=162155 RepID=UPI0025DD21DA|nr:DNA adenine methylase [uncultured Treponema sp.]
MEENRDFLTTQIITYLGNKRTLIGNIEKEVNEISEKLGKNRLLCADLFSGSGIVARMLKKYSSKLIVNDLENYSSIINSCYLTNKKDFPKKRYDELHAEIENLCAQEKFTGIIAKNYAPQDDENIQKGERVFYTHENAVLIDTYRKLIDDIVKEESMKKFFLAPLITEASIHVNTSGVFKGFYKDRNTGIGCFGASGRNALPRIFGKIELKEPVFSNFDSEIEIYKKNTVELAKELENIDIAYLDPPYNQHPYGSNYFMLNLILKNRLDVEISRVSGITQDWNRSAFNRPRYALSSMEEIISVLKAKYTIISYNSEGFISFDEMSQMLSKYGKLKTVEIKYNTFRGSRNLRNRDIHVSEYLFVLEK